MQSTSTQTFRTVGTQITECDTEELPTEIIGESCKFNWQIWLRNLPCRTSCCT